MYYLSSIMMKFIFSKGVAESKISIMLLIHNIFFWITIILDYIFVHKCDLVKLIKYNHGEHYRVGDNTKLKYLSKSLLTKPFDKKSV